VFLSTSFCDTWLEPQDYQSDEAYQVGKGLTPVGAYLAQDDIIRIALEHGVDMIHPG
jgi:pyruvate carboxylase